MMRVLFNALQLNNRSGTGRYCAELLRAFAEIAPDLELTACLPRGSRSEEEPDAGGPAFRVSHSAFRNVPTTCPRVFMEHWLLPHQARNFDLVHYPASVGPLFPATNLVLTVHDLAVFRHPEWFTRGRALYYRAAITRGVRQARRIIADSRATAQELQELLDVPPDLIDIIPLGVSPHFAPVPLERIEAIRRQYALPADFFLFVGTFEPRKNLERLITAWDSVAACIPENLVLAGRRGWRDAPILEAIQRSPFRSRIHLPSHVPEHDLPALLSAARAFVWPSLYEGFGLPPLEAMACGTPVITSNTSSLPEITGDAALLVDPHEVDAIAQALRRVSANAALRDELRAKGLTRAAQFTWHHTGDLTLRSYKGPAED
ncbi:MAG: glycosyltransferase family 4 protein [Candidatus Hydrogenedentes bacterium]|nr:glycosyltransferase family 4 protein [Candidatus Hydrogenedentota bacterium]